MSYKNLVTMNIAVIGRTKLAMDYTSKFAHAGHHAILAWAAEPEKVDNSISHILPNVSVTTITEAAMAADMIIIATSSCDVRAAAYWLDDVRKKVIVDASTNNIGGPECAINSYQAIKAITGTDHVVKVFATSGYEGVLQPIFKNNIADMLLLSNSLKAKEIMKIMGVEIGLHKFYDFGDDENIKLFDEMTNTWKKLSQKVETKNALDKLPGISE